MDSTMHEDAFNPNNPWSDDKLNRKEFATLVESIVTRSSRPLVVNIDGAYGSGKSFVLKRIYYSLLKENYAVVSFDAWKTDFADDPFVVFVSEMSTQFEEKGLLEKQKKRDFRRKATAYLTKRLIPTAIKLSTVGILTSDDISFEDSVASEIGSLANRMAEEQLLRFESTNKALNDFQDSLRSIIHHVNDSSEFSGSSIFVFVDELDRCRPAYAIDLLEIIKHLFSIDGIVFILASDVHQLEESVKTQYGRLSDASGYWNKLIDLNLRLPERSVSFLVLDHLDRLDFPDIDNAFKKYLAEYINFLSILFNLSLRACEKHIKRLFLIDTNKPKGTRWRVHDEIITLASLMEQNKACFEKIRDGRAKPRNIAYELIRDLNMARLNPKNNKDSLRVFWKTIFLTQIQRNLHCPPGASDQVDLAFQGNASEIVLDEDSDHMEIAREGFAEALAEYNSQWFAELKRRDSLSYIDYMTDLIEFSRIVR